MALKPCLTCGAPSEKSYCPTHWKQRRAIYQGDYPQARAQLLATTPEICELCGQGPIPGDPWTADHIAPGDPHSQLRRAHRTCNSRRARLGGER